MSTENLQDNTQGIDTTQQWTSTTLAKIFETILNQSVAMDEMQGIGFQMLDEKVIQLTFTDLKLTFFIIYQLDAAKNEKSTRLGHFTVQAHLMGSADTHIKTTLTDWLRRNTETESPLGSAFLAALYTIDIDWEEQLSHFTGDFIAFNISQTARSTKQNFKAAKQKAGVTLKEYLQFEINLLPTKLQVAHFNQEVEDLADEVDALAARVDALTHSTPK
ncbi:ubiquinone biosynthesis accessory factor UbiJ [Hydrogenovibrio marinus]|uniref:Ubiquinone biosynthesis accessory factor UbiJ n=1 Tax=Hydrogenovibrio marinus TaxID=28885 RepID=A0A067A223_HYDMR|nr:hypothetical protein [Hydrogenovibrio marinus]KDN96415.1 hypothetical protein EI16_09105 [Hydrogenovibrio marinus]BBN60389.1 hypothetical protein HVMH_1983 [Hydrogenovibrio marinus]